MSAGDWKALFKACEEGDEALVTYYLQQGVDPNYQHPEFMTTPLIESVRLNKINIIKVLLSYGADPEIKEAWGEETAITEAEKRGLKEIMALLNQRADSK